MFLLEDHSFCRIIFKGTLSKISSQLIFLTQAVFFFMRLSTCRSGLFLYHNFSSLHVGLEFLQVQQVCKVVSFYYNVS